MKNYYPENREPNLKIWTCPICIEEFNSRGAAAHLRINHNIEWNPNYLNNPSEIYDMIPIRCSQDIYYMMMNIFQDIDLEGNPEYKDIVYALTILVFKARINMMRDSESPIDALNSVLKRIKGLMDN